MILDPLGYKMQHNNDSYEKLVNIKNYLNREIRHFEKHREELMKEIEMCPSPEVFYLMNLEYLVVICELIQEKYNEEDN